MDVELIARGNPEAIRKIAEDFEYAEKDGIFLINIPKNLLKYTLNLLNSSNIETIDYSHYIQIVQSEIKSSEINRINSEEAFKWLRTGKEFFYTISGSRFEMHSMDKRNVNVVSSAEPITKCFMSNEGGIYGFIRGQSASFHIGDNLDLLWDVKLKHIPNKIIFSDNNKYVAICMVNKSHIYNLMKGSFISSINFTDFCFVQDSIYFSAINRLLEISGLNQMKLTLDELSLEPKGLSCSIYSKNRTARFEDDKLQKLIYDNGKEQTIKNYINVKKVDLNFTENRLFVFLIKNPGKEEHYSLDSMHDGEVTSNSFDFRILSWTVSDNFFVVQQSNHEVKFFNKEKKLFTLVNTIKKDGQVLFAITNTMCCLFDSSSNSIEFYDKGELRSIFSHPGCTQIKWSESGMYVATFSCNPATGSLVQIFDCDGFLMFRKIFNSLRDFEWRFFPEVPEDERKKILAVHSLVEIEEPEDDEIIKKKILLKEWMDYLMSKIKK